MPVYGVPRDLPPFSLSFETIVLDDLTYTIGSFDAYVDTSRDYATWFTESSTGPIIRDVSMNGGGVVRGIICAQVTSRAEWKVCVEALQTKVIELEATVAVREVHMQE